MKVRNLNNSSFKTKTLIKETFAEILYEQRNIHKISVTELVRRANINRSTFYSHYDDIWQVAEDIKSETMKAFFDNKAINDINDILPFFDDIYKYIKKNDDFFRLIFNSDEVTGFVLRLGKICKDKIYCVLKDNSEVINKSLLEVEISAFSDGLAMQFIRYYHNDYSVTLEEIIEFGKFWCKQMIANRINH